MRFCGDASKKCYCGQAIAWRTEKLLPQLRATLQDLTRSGRFLLVVIDEAHHLFIAGLFNHTKGVACYINNVCRAVLLLGVTANKRILDETDLKRVLLDLGGCLE